MAHEVPIRFYVDADLMSVGMALARLRPDLTHAGHPAALDIQQSTKDTIWIPLVGREGWIILTKDQHIRTRPGEILAVYTSKGRMVVITGNKKLNSFDRTRILLGAWDEIEELEAMPGPWIYSLTSAGLRQMCPPWPAHVLRAAAGGSAAG